MTTLQDRIQKEINELPLIYQKEVFDFILFLKEKEKLETDMDYISKNPEIKQAIIDGLKTPLSECSKQLDW